MKIAITCGCPAGIGPEISAAAAKNTPLPKETTLIWCASPELFLKGAQRAGIQATQHNQTVMLESCDGLRIIECTHTANEDLGLLANAGKPDNNALTSQKQSLLKAIELAKQKQVQAIVTAPIRKAALTNIDGKSFAGQTELLHYYLKADNDPALMCFAGYDFVLGLSTVHVPIKEVTHHITKTRLAQQLKRLREAAAQIFNLDKTTVRITVLGLNPHAGESGLLGDEEIKTIIPVVEQFKKDGYTITGPVSADGFFGFLHQTPKTCWPHAVLAMYHDQGLAPYKLLAKDRVANVTFGLTLPRTSPAHGTADDIAGKHLANPASMIEALRLASSLALSRRNDLSV